MVSNFSKSYQESTKCTDETILWEGTHKQLNSHILRPGKLKLQAVDGRVQFKHTAVTNYYGKQENKLSLAGRLFVLLPCVCEVRRGDVDGSHSHTHTHTHRHRDSVVGLGGKR